MTTDEVLANAKREEARARRRNRWLYWRDVVLLLAVVTIVMLVRQVGDLQQQITKNSADRASQIEKLTDQISAQSGELQALRRQRLADQQQAAADAARIKQLTDLLIANDVPVPAAPVVAPSTSSSGGSPSPSPTTRPTSTPTATARPTVTARPSSSPTPRPSTSPGCRTPVILGICPLPGPASHLSLGLGRVGVGR